MTICWNYSDESGCSRACRGVAVDPACRGYPQVSTLQSISGTPLNPRRHDGIAERTDSMIDTKGAPYGALLLRVSLGILFLAHGLYLKVMVFGLPGTAQYLGSLGLPSWFGYLVPLYETLGGLALILGFYTRYVAFLLGLHMLVATYMGHSGNGWMFANQGGGWE